MISFLLTIQKKNLKRLINSNFLFVNLHSTLGYELISRGVKCIFFNHHTLYHGKKYRKEGLFGHKIIIKIVFISYLIIL